ncbi:DUF4382 domain-containing protein [Cellulophaga baltica]|uniref:Carboxypeptidase regulatory-like domain-containing protein n=1 Tax=Cellulophaga baltica TaxID=76594 RepID=A0A1G7G8W4_9FLAO|nr:DUF4382 domain-containing protein [Cellulophaga baltica]SDE84515.1 Carboxypeptidase regulatory-like domain-containing protein [Cellulophaga baltica]
MKLKLVFTSILSMVFLLFGCSDNNDTANGGTGTLSIQLTDAPFLYDMVAEANVTIFKIDARYKGAVETDSVSADGNSFITLSEEEVPINLLELTNGITENLVNLEVPAGTYDLVRVYVKGVNAILNDGTVYDLNVPSGEQTGIKVFIQPGLVVQGGLSSDLLLDFDVSKSFVAKGGRNNLSGFNFKPVIKASNLATAGTLKGLVTTTEDNISVGLEGAQVSVIVADTINTTTFSDIDGRFVIMGLQEGSYDLLVALEGYTSERKEGIAIVASNNTTQDVVLSLEE